MRELRIWGLLCLLGAVAGCYATAPPPEQTAPASKQPLDGGSVYEVMDAAGRVLVPLGEAQRSPERRGAPAVIAQGVAVEFADEKALSEPHEFTVVDGRGTCVTRAKSRLLVGRHERSAARWIEAFELDGCAGDPTAPRVALAGASSEARWIAAQEVVFIDGELVTGSQFLERETDGKQVLRQYHFPGSDLTLESEYRAPATRAVPLRLLKGKRLIGTYPGAKLAGAVGVLDRLLIVMQGRGLTVVEIVGDSAVTLLSPDG